MKRVQFYEVTEHDDQQRLDRWIRRHINCITQSRLERMCRRGEVRVNGLRVRCSTRLIAGQTIRVPPYQTVSQPAEKVFTHPDNKTIQRFEESIIFEDQYLVAINKEAGIATQGGTGLNVHIDKILSSIQNFHGEKLHLVHRLDRATSGILILGKGAHTARAMAKLFRQRKVKKIYWAVTYGVPEPKIGTIRLALVKGYAGDRRKMILSEDNISNPDHEAKPAVTDYRVYEKVGSFVGLVALSPQTGRTHQLRAHLSAISCPIIGDTRYGLKDWHTSGLINLGIKDWGLHLHARSVQFIHPFTGKDLYLKADFPSHMQRTLSLCNWDIADIPKEPFGSI